MLGTEMVEGVPDECFVPRSGQCLSTRLNFNEEGGGVGNGGQMRRSQELRVGRGTHKGTIPTRKCIQLCQSMVQLRKNGMCKTHTPVSLEMLDLMSNSGTK